MRASRFHAAWLLRWAWTRWREVRLWHGRRPPGAVGGWSLIRVTQEEHMVSSTGRGNPLPLSVWGRPGGRWSECPAGFMRRLAHRSLLC